MRRFVADHGDAVAPLTRREALKHIGPGPAAGTDGGAGPSGAGCRTVGTVHGRCVGAPHMHRDCAACLPASSKMCVCVCLWACHVPIGCLACDAGCTRGRAVRTARAKATPPDSDSDADTGSGSDACSPVDRDSTARKRLRGRRTGAAPASVAPSGAGTRSASRVGLAGAVAPATGLSSSNGGDGGGGRGSASAAGAGAGSHPRSGRGKGALKRPVADPGVAGSDVHAAAGAKSARRGGGSVEAGTRRR